MSSTIPDISRSNLQRIVSKAVRLFSENRGKIDLLILDVLMPVKKRPDRGSLAVNAEFLSKPLSPSMLLKKLQQLLASKNSNPKSPH